MKKITSRLILLLGIILHISSNSSGQLSEFIYGIYGYSGTYYFSKVHIPTGVYTSLQPVSFAAISSNMSSSVGVSPPRYYLCTGSAMMTFDPLSGSLIANAPLPVSAAANFIFTQYNPCDDNIYGILVNSTLIQFTRFNLADSTMHLISNLSIPNMFAVGAESMIDPVNGIYYVHSYNFLAINIYTGSIMYNVPSNVRHEAFEISSFRVIGTIGSNNEKILASFNPQTGITTNISATPWTVGYLKPLGGGSSIDQSAGIFYYSAAGAGIIGVETTNGTVASNVDLNLPGELYFIKHFSAGQCLPTDVNRNNKSLESISIFPNPVATQLTINNGELKIESLEIFNLLGEKVYDSAGTLQSNIQNINVSKLTTGIYFLKVKAQEGEKALKFVKQ